MKLKDCKHGVLVTCNNEIGMIVGLTNNCPTAEYRVRAEIDRAIPLVQFSGDLTPRGVHHGNLSIYKG